MPLTGPRPLVWLVSAAPGSAPPVGLEPTTDRLEGCCSIL